MRKDGPYLTAIGDLVPPNIVSSINWRNINFVGVTGHRVWAYFRYYGPLHSQCIVEWRIFYCDGVEWKRVEWENLPIGIQFYLIRQFLEQDWHHSCDLIPWDEGMEVMAALENM